MATWAALRSFRRALLAEEDALGVDVVDALAECLYGAEGRGLLWRPADIGRPCFDRKECVLTAFVRRAGGAPVAFAPAPDAATFAARLGAAAPFLSGFPLAGPAPLALAGAGAAEVLLRAEPAPDTHYELFQVGPGESRAGELERHLRGAWPELEVVRTPGRLGFRGPGGRRVDLHLEARPSVAQLLYSFGLGAEAVAFNGATVSLSAAGLLAARRGLLIAPCAITPGAMVPGLSARLGAHLARGFDLVLLGPDPRAQLERLGLAGAKKVRPHSRTFVWSPGSP